MNDWTMWRACVEEAQHQGNLKKHFKGNSDLYLRYCYLILDHDLATRSSLTKLVKETNVIVAELFKLKEKK